MGQPTCAMGLGHFDTPAGPKFFVTLGLVDPDLGPLVDAKLTPSEAVEIADTLRSIATEADTKNQALAQG